MITVNLEPDGKRVELSDIRSVLAVLNRLQLRSTMAIVVRDGELLTADRKLLNGDVLMVRKVTSAGQGQYEVYTLRENRPRRPAQSPFRVLQGMLSVVFHQAGGDRHPPRKDVYP